MVMGSLFETSRSLPCTAGSCTTEGIVRVFEVDSCSRICSIEGGSKVASSNIEGSAWRGR